jgi:signal transduction histidine kinase
VGGRLIDFEVQGVRAGELGLRILRGETPKSLPILDEGATAYMFDGRELQRWGISGNRLPPGSIVRYEAASVWTRHRWRVIGGGMLTLAGALLITGFLLQRTARKRAELSLAERLRFESLLSELSARLIHVPLDKWDVEIEKALQQVVEFLRIDRARLNDFVPDQPPLCISWAAAEIEPQLRIAEPEQFPWTASQLERGQIVRFSRLDELPVEAVVDRQGYQSMGTRSSLSLPLSASGPLLGVLFFESVRRERIWPEELVQRLQPLSQVFARALERKHAELALAERLRFETLLAEQSLAFSSLSAADIDREIERGLRQIVDFLKVDRGSLAEFSADSRTAHITHSWAAEGVERLPSAIRLGQFPWVAARVQRGEVVRFSRSEELPEQEAAVDRRTFLTSGITSHVEVPLMVEGTVVGALALSTLATERAWRDELVQRLRLLGEVFANILSRRRSELEAQRLRRDLAHVGRVSTLGELTASLAHELNQPLTAILSNAQAAQRILEADAANLEEVSAILKDIIEDDQRAAAVIHRLRGLLKKGDLELSILDLNELVAEVARLVSSDMIARDVLLRLELTPGLPPVSGDRVQLQQVVLNLILNGLDALQESRTGDRTLVLRTDRAGPAAVRVAVQDSGVGVDEADLDHIFHAFYTTKTHGLGMGLAIARSIVEAHGGRLEAQNNADGGATFSFTVPRSDKEQ